MSKFAEKGTLIHSAVDYILGLTDEKGHRK